uniref:Centrosomal protein 41 n=1 Tax=Sphaeramia orbicularis TaxID=375764 RepID=A0A672Z0L1_9TELE
MSLNRGIGSAEYMAKRIPKNAKYHHIKTRLDTGCSLTKYMERLEEIKRNYRYRKDEIFKRLKVTTFAQLVSINMYFHPWTYPFTEFTPIFLCCLFADVLSVVSDAELESLSEHTNGSPQASLVTDHPDSREAKDICCTSRSTLLSVISGVGELNLDKGNHQPMLSSEPGDRPYPDCPYLLLDVRDRDQYDRCHIITAHSFPITMLSRTMNPYTKEVLDYRNAAGKIIIVYDEDERIASQAATTMCERGCENLFMLSGGLKIIAQKFPEGLTTGTIPTSCLSPPASLKGKKCSAPQHTPQVAEKRWRFTSDELTKIQEQLEEILIPTNPNSKTSPSFYYNLQNLIF